MEKNLILTKAQGAVMARDFTTAARLYKQLLQEDASNVNYLTEIGSIYVKAGEDERAIPYYEQILTFYPHYVEAMNSLGAIYRRLKRYEESIQILQRAVDEGRQAASVNYNLGFTYKEMGNYNDAIDAFELVIQDNPDDVLAYNHLGSIYYAKKDYQKSIQSYKRGLQIDQNHPILNYNLARCYEASGSVPDAIRCYSATIKTRPGWNDAIRDFSGLLINCQKNKEAQDIVQQAINLHPTDGDLLCILGQIYLNQFDYDNAQKTFQKADTYKADDVKILMGLSQSFEKGEKTSKALDVAQRAMDIEPDNPEVRKQYVHTLLSSEEYDRAYEHVQELYEQTGDSDVEVLDLYGQYYICRGEEDKAQEYYKKIQQQNHHYKDYMLEAAARYSQIGKYDNAEKIAKQYVERRGQNPEGYNTLGKIYSQKGDLLNAKASYDKSISLRSPNIMANKQVKELEERIAEAENLPPLQEEVFPENHEEETVTVEEQIAVTEETPSENFDFGSMGDNVPMGEALVEDENKFFETDPEEEALRRQQEEAEAALKNEDEPEFYFPSADSSQNDSKRHDLSDEEDPFDLFGDDTSGKSDKPDLSDLTEKTEEPEPEEKVVSEPEPMPEIPPVSMPKPSEMDKKFQQQAIDSATSAMEAAFNAQRLAQTLADQQLQMMEQTRELVKSQMEQALELQKNQNDNSEPEEKPVEETLSEEVAEEPEVSEEAENKIEEKSEESVEENNSQSGTGDLLGKIERILSDTDSAKKYESEIELFKKLKVLCDYLPDSEKDSFYSCRIRMQIEYIIARLSGKPGLLLTAASLLKSGALGDEYSDTVDDEPLYLNNELLSRMIIFMKKMTEDLEDKNLAKALQGSADVILEKIELENQKSAIF